MVNLSKFSSAKTEVQCRVKYISLVRIIAVLYIVSFPYCALLILVKVVNLDCLFASRTQNEPNDPKEPEKYNLHYDDVRGDFYGRHTAQHQLQCSKK